MPVFVSVGGCAFEHWTRSDMISQGGWYEHSYLKHIIPGWADQCGQRPPSSLSIHARHQDRKIVASWMWLHKLQYECCKQNVASQMRFQNLQVNTNNDIEIDKNNCDNNDHSKIRQSTSRATARLVFMIYGHQIKFKFSMKFWWLTNDRGRARCPNVNFNLQVSVGHLK